MAVDLPHTLLRPLDGLELKKGVRIRRPILVLPHSQRRLCVSRRLWRRRPWRPRPARRAVHSPLCDASGKSGSLPSAGAASSGSPVSSHAPVSYFPHSQSRTPEAAQALASAPTLPVLQHAGSKQTHALTDGAGGHSRPPRSRPTSRPSSASRPRRLSSPTRTPGPRAATTTSTPCTSTSPRSTTSRGRSCRGTGCSSSSMRMTLGACAATRGSSRECLGSPGCLGDVC